MTRDWPFPCGRAGLVRGSQGRMCDIVCFAYVTVWMNRATPPVIQSCISRWGGSDSLNDIELGMRDLALEKRLAVRPRGPDFGAAAGGYSTGIAPDIEADLV